MTSIQLAHLTDFHLPPPGAPEPASLLGKRLLGYLSWRRKRRWRHDPRALERLVEDCRSRRPEAALITGDVVNLALPDEFTSARKWLSQHFDSKTTFLAPGNHDAYARLDWGEGLARLADFMIGTRYDDPALRPPASGDDFPYVQTVGPARLIVLNTARTTAPGLATGRLGRRQRERLQCELAAAAEAGLCRIVALHHPVAKGVVSRRKALDDAAALRAVFAETGVELVVHGHAHRPTWSHVETPAGARPAAGGGSASHPRGYDHYAPARYTLFTIAQAPSGEWRIDAAVRQIDPETGAVGLVEERRLL